MSRLQTLIAVAASLIVADAALAQAVTADPAAVKSGVFKVEHHTQVSFSISHLGLSDYQGFFRDPSGELTLDVKNPAASKLTITVPVDTITSTVPQLDTLLKTKAWFDVATYPTATFVSTSIRRTGDGTAVIEGNLTMHGVTKPVTLNAKLIGSGTNLVSKAYSVGFSASGALKRSDFGMKTLLPALTDDVTLNVTGSFEAKP